MKVGNLRIRNALLCDDIRSEINNKHTLVGVYEGDIVVPAFPCSIPAALYIEGEVKKPGDTQIVLRMSGPGNDETVFNAKFSTTTKNDAVSVPIRLPAVRMGQAGTFRFEANADNEKWVTLVEKKVGQSDDLRKQPAEN